MKTFMPKKGDLERKWYLLDANQKVLGRFASQIAVILMGKSKPAYTPHIEAGDYVIVVNAENIQVTGKKAKTKEYQRYSGYPGGLKRRSFEWMKENKPEEIIRLAVKRMLPKTVLGRKLLKNLKIYRGFEHPHSAQNPIPFE